MDPATKPLVIPVFIPHSGCPHQCAFCNQATITGQIQALPDRAAILDRINQYLLYRGGRRQVELAFFGGSFLGLARDQVVRILNWAQAFVRDKKIDGIRFSTRPDTITRETVDLIKPYAISAVELGVQSMNDRVLARAGRGHTGQDTVTALELLKERQYRIGVQVMVGLPGDDETSLMDSTKKLVHLSPDFARIYPLMVLEGSRLADWYREGRYQPLSLDHSICLAKKMVLIFRAARVEVIRLGLQASDMMEDDSRVLAGPWHPAFGHLVFSGILYDHACEQIDACPGLAGSDNIVLRVHPRWESRLRGDRNMNMKKFERQYPGARISICLDEGIPMDRVEAGNK
jgi:histone acetyltransferase (RNA polymerase elongator complex component)